MIVGQELYNLKWSELKNINDPTKVIERVLAVEKNHQAGVGAVNKEARRNLVPERYRGLLQRYERCRTDNAEDWVLLEPIKTKARINKGEWYKRTRLGRGQIGEVMREACADAGIDITGRKRVPHLMRATTITNIVGGGVAETFGMMITGHKSVHGYRSYVGKSEVQNMGVAEYSCNRR
jgi:hypothetical protein